MGGRRGGHDFPNTTVQVRVFNRDFVNESVFPVGGGDVPPIFILGTGSVEKQKTVNRLIKERSKLEVDLYRAQETLTNSDRKLDTHTVTCARNIKDTLRIPGPGAYNEFDKRSYRMLADKMLANKDIESHRLNDTVRNHLLMQHTDTIKPQVTEIEYIIPDVRPDFKAVATLRTSTVTSSVLEELDNDPQLSRWSREGLLLHKERQLESCLYCQQLIPANRKAALEAHFSTEYDRFLNRVDDLLERLTTLETGFNTASPPDKAAFYNNIRDDYVAAKSAYENALNDQKSFVHTLIQSIKEKKEQPFKSLATDLTIPSIDSDVANRLNEVICRHNVISRDFQSSTNVARDRLAMGMIADYSEEYSDLKTAASLAEKAIEPIKTEIGHKSQEIERLEREIVEHRQPAEELNDDLIKYLGHDELSLAVKETGYEFMRHGRPADSLSEGERTALALLYFLKSLDDRSFSLDNGVVVLDDPVSSLDENSIYLAFGYIKQHTQNAAQLFLLTHNFTFFRLVRNWFHHLPRQRKQRMDQRPARFYMLERVRDSATRCTTIQPLDSLLEEYESEYHYLFARLYRERSVASGTTLEHLYDLPNVARRLLESFLAFRRPQVSRDLWTKLQDSDFDQSRKTRIIRFVNAHSHTDGISEPEHDLSLLGEARSVLDDILEFMEFEDPGHYEAMVEVVT